MRTSRLWITAAVIAALVVSLGASGCAREPTPTPRPLLQRELSRAFKRAFDAEQRMRTGRSQTKLVKEARARCAPRGPDPRERREWPWRCRIRYLSRAGTTGQARYDVRVDPRGCFSASSGDYPPVIFERAIGRRSRNPLAEFRSCP